MRIVNSLRIIVGERDYCSALLLVTIALIALWLASLPFFKFTQQAALNRFHLQNDSFLAWSVQQIVPSIYNFENEYEFTSDSKMADPELEKFMKSKMLNHFPMRIVSYFDGRYMLFNKGNGGQLMIRSRYQDLELVTRWQIEPTPEGGLRLTQRQTE